MFVDIVWWLEFWVIIVWLGLMLFGFFVRVLIGMFNVFEFYDFSYLFDDFWVF